MYVSCDSATLARDLKYLCERGYELRQVCPVDQFGMTVHVETVVLLSQPKPDDMIEIDLDLDELDATSAETKATYQEIKDYVLKEDVYKRQEQCSLCTDHDALYYSILYAENKG